MFPEITQGYDFWAQSDLDVIFGDIRYFLTQDFLASYDFIRLRHDYTTGCFALYRNNEKMNTFFMKSKDFRLVFSNSTTYSEELKAFNYRIGNLNWNLISTKTN